MNDYRRDGLAIVISGPSGSGKGTVVNLLRELYPEAELSVSATSRAIRPNETEGVTYHYLTKEAFEKLIGDGAVLEYACYDGNYYGTPKEPVDRALAEGRDMILEIEVQGAGQVREKLAGQVVSIMLLAPSGAEQERRLRERNTESEERILSRIRKAREEIRHASEYDYIVVNETGRAKECAEEILAIIRAEHVRAARMKRYVHDYFEDDEI